MYFFTYVLSALAASHAVLALKMSDRFTVSANCNGRNVDEMIQGALTMVTNSVKALETLIKGGEELDPMKGGRDKIYLITAAYRAWGTVKASRYGNGYGPDDINQLKAAKKNFESVQRALRDGEDMLPQNNFFHCNDDRLQEVTKAVDIFPQLANGPDKDTSLEDYFRQRGAKGIKSLWKDPDHMWGSEYNSFWLPPGEKVCRSEDDDALTITVRGSPLKNMVYCPGTWTGPLVPNVAGFKDKRGRVSWARDMDSRPGSFLHEMFHWRMFRRPVIDEDLRYEDGAKFQCYGLIKCYMLANEFGRDGKRRALTNADSYNVFATMVTAKHADITS